MCCATIPKDVYQKVSVGGGGDEAIKHVMAVLEVQGVACTPINSSLVEWCSCRTYKKP